MTDLPQENPGWLTGPVNFIERRSERVGVYELAGHGPVMIDVDDPRHRIILRSGLYDNLDLRAEGDLPGGTRVEVSTPRQDRVSINVRAEIDLIVTATNHHLERLNVGSNTIRSLETTDVTRINVDRLANRRERIDLSVKANHHHETAVDGLIRVTELTGTANKIICSAPLAPGAVCDVEGTLQLGVATTVGSRVTATDEVAVGKSVSAGSVITCLGGRVRVGGTVNGTEEQPVVVRASEIVVDGDAQHLHVDADEVASQRVELKSAATASDIKARLIYVRGDVSGCAFETDAEQGQTGMCLGGQLVENGDEASRLETPVGTIKDTTIDAEAGATLHLSTVEATRVTAPESSVTVHHLDLTEGRFESKKVKAQTTTGPADHLVAGEVHVEGDADLHGDLTATMVTAKGRLGQSPDDDAEPLQVTAGRVELEQPRLPSTCVISGYLSEGGDTPTLTVEGSATIQTVDGETVIDLKEAKQHSIVTTAEIGRISATAPTSEVTVILRDDAELARLESAGQVAVMGVRSRQHAVEIDDQTATIELQGTPQDKAGLRTVVLAPRSHLCLGPDSTEIRYRFDIHPDAGSIFDVEVDVEGYSVDLQAVANNEDTPSPCVVLTGPVTVDLSGDLSALKAIEAPEGRPSAAGPPTLRTRADGRVAEATGTLRLGLPFLGRLHGPLTKRKDTGRTLSVVGLDGREDEDRKPAGVVTDFDPGRIPYGELDLLDEVRVVDATPKSLRDYAMSDPGPDGDPRLEYRERAEWLRRFTEIAAKRASAGTTVSSARWAMLRMHHESLPWALNARGVEKAGRSVHRALGYSNKIWPPALSLLLTTLTLAGLKHLVDGFTMLFGEKPMSWDALWNSLHDTALLPVAILRLGAGSEPLIWNGLLNAFATIAMAIPLAFLLIAIRNRLREPE